MLGISRRACRPVNGTFTGESGLSAERVTVDFSHLDGPYLVVAGVFLLLIAAQAWLVNRERGWLGVFVPATYFGILMFLGITGRVSSLADFVFAALGLLGLLAWWISVREARRRSKEELSEFSPSQSATDPGDVSPPSSTGVRRHFLISVA